MDKQLRQEIIDTIRKAIQQVEEENNERYLSSEDLCKQFGMLTKDWVARNGKYLPRERIVIDGQSGTRWGYPQKKIARMIREGKLRNINVHEDKEQE